MCAMQTKSFVLKQEVFASLNNKLIRLFSNTTQFVRIERGKRAQFNQQSATKERKHLNPQNGVQKMLSKGN